MEARLGFGLRDEKGEVWYSSEHWLEGFEFDQIPPVGLQLRFDVPIHDGHGRWAKCNDGSYDIDGGDPIHAKVDNVEAHVCDNTQSRIAFLHVDLEVDEGEPFRWPQSSEKEKVEKLLEFCAYLAKLKHAGKTEISHSESGFTHEQSHFLQRKMCASVADVASRYLNSFHKHERSMVKSIEKILKEKWGLMFCVGPGWLSWRGPVEETKSKPKKTGKKS